VRATSDVTTCTLVAWGFAPLLDTEPEVTTALLLAMCERVRWAESR
jgi:hypothetical protein